MTIIIVQGGKSNCGLSNNAQGDAQRWIKLFLEGTPTLNLTKFFTKNQCYQNSCNGIQISHQAETRQSIISVLNCLLNALIIIHTIIFTDINYSKLCLFSGC